MNANNIEDMETLKQQADALWTDIIELGKMYWSFYEEAFLSGEPNGKKLSKELFIQDDLPF